VLCEQYESVEFLARLREQIECDEFVRRSGEGMRLDARAQRTVVFDISSTSNFDQLLVTGTVALGTTATLQLNIASSLNFQIGAQYTLIDNDGIGDAISGAFANAANGSTVTLGGYNFTINYAAGDGNDFVLTAVPEVGTWAVPAFALTAIVLIQRRRIGKLRVF
jgi:hypothetical protein